LFLHSIAHQRATGITAITEQQKKRLSEFKSSNNQKAHLQYISAQLFLKDTLTTEEESLLELSLSSIINYVHPSFKKFYNDTSLQFNNTNYEFQGGLTTEEAVLFDEIANNTDIDKAIAYVQKKKCKLSEEKKRSCREYVMLSLVEKVLEDIELWNDDEKEQEITYYRRTASLLDVLFKGTDIMLIE
jgi:hypothetical protein